MLSAAKALATSPRILQLGKFYPILGGVEKVMYDFMRGLAARGVDCDMLTAERHGRGRVIPLSDHARLITCRTWRKQCATMIAPSMLTTLRRCCADYDLIHIHHPDPMAALALRLSGYKGKVVLHWHSDIQKQRYMLKAYAPLQRWLLRRATLIVGTSPLYLAGSPCLRRVQAKTVCLPIGVEAVCPDEAEAARIRARYGGRKIVFSLGRLVAYKGYQYLIEAARYLPDDYVVLIGGSGAMKNYLQGEIKRYGLANRVFLLGRISDRDLPAYYGACTLFCLSSTMKTEAFGIVQIEAMSCGKPVVATRIPQSGVSWVNAHGESGLNVPPQDARALAEAIRTIADDAKVYDGYSRRARRRYEELFTNTRMIDNLLALYQRIL